jgi:hypothetical protein
MDRAAYSKGLAAIKGPRVCAMGATAFNSVGESTVVVCTLDPHSTPKGIGGDDPANRTVQ